MQSEAKAYVLEGISLNKTNYFSLSNTKTTYKHRLSLWPWIMCSLPLPFLCIPQYFSWPTDARHPQKLPRKHHFILTTDNNWALLNSKVALKSIELLQNHEPKIKKKYEHIRNKIRNVWNVVNTKSQRFSCQSCFADIYLQLLLMWLNRSFYINIFCLSMELFASI